ncbi:alpha beta hydrolase fold-3 [Fusarium phyllophilum]|uniref:Alpha beta hydrolase fold-3 n=1 Tax=Fusarium phyllophilum TaxID=47803 RepID=A0A8H5NAS3_9HYPO|nr:alpha beta hydrolase fold-3 [Fusarium phyllophilum]
MAQPPDQNTQRQPATIARPALDPSFVECLNNLVHMFPSDMDVHGFRQLSAPSCTPDIIRTKFPNLELEEFEIKGLDNNNVTIALFRANSTLRNALPVFYFMHPGGIDAVFASVEYRLAPEYPALAALNDAFAGLNWLIEHAEELAIDTSRIILSGVSGGGAIAAGCAILYTKKRSNPPLLGVILSTPMLDGRDSTVSSRQFAKQTLWSGDFN